jgi:drug/metabolite transporter (DMT)-like permease
LAEKTTRARVIAAFGAVYVIWGSTYLAIKYAIETLPPFLMAGVRFAAAGTILYAWSLTRAERGPTRAEWRAAAIIGALLLLGGNGAVVWAEQTVPSGIAALLVAVTPCWIVLLDWLWHRGERPGALTWGGLVLGVVGIVLLVGPDSLRGDSAIPLAGVAVLMCGSVAWAIGSIYSKRAPTAPGALLSTGMQMLCGGALLTLAGLITGEASRLDVARISLRSVLALLYLLIFGALIGYSAYVWLLRVARPARVATYAYVNPLVAVVLGWALAGEALSLRMGIAAGVIVAGVAMITIDSN